MYVEHAKVMVILQGPYTAERRSALKVIGEKFGFAACIISDETYRKQRNTACTAERTEEYYDYFKQETTRALENGCNVLIIDPTLSDPVQNSYYLSLAHRMQYAVLVVPPVVTGPVKGEWPKGSQAASFHPLDICIRPWTMFEHLFCGWFLHDVDSDELRHEAALYLRDCVQELPAFKEMLAKFCRLSDKGGSTTHESATWTFSDDLVAESAVALYHLEDQGARRDLAFCATKLFRGNLRATNEYFQKVGVVENYGKVGKLFVAGFIISPHMVAARVKLTYKQKDLWDMDDEMDEGVRPNYVGPSVLVQQANASLPDVQARLISSKSNKTLVSSGRCIYEPLETIHRFARGRGCHIVVGSSPGAPLANVDFDVQFALRRERKAANVQLLVEDLERCLVKRIGKYWYLYLKEMVLVDGLFASCVKPYGNSYC